MVGVVPSGRCSDVAWSYPELQVPRTRDEKQPMSPLPEAFTHSWQSQPARWPGTGVLTPRVRWEH